MAKPDPFKYSYEIVVKIVSLALPGAANIFVMMKRGDNKIQTKSLIGIDQKNTVAKFNETLTFALTLYKQNEVFLEKRMKITVNAVSSSNKIKILGECLIDLAVLALESKPTTKTYKLQNCIDKNASIELEIKANPIEEVHKAEQSKSEESTQQKTISRVKKSSPPVQKLIDTSKHNESVRSEKMQQENGDETSVKYGRLKEKAIKFKRERDEARENEKKLLAQIGKLESERTRASQATDLKPIDTYDEIEELKDDLRLYKERVTELNKERGEIQALYSKASAECGTANSRAEQYRKDNEQLVAKIKSLEADCSRYAIECKNLNKTIDSSKAKIKDLTLKLESKAGKENTTLSEYKGQTDGIIADLKKQLKEKEEAVIAKEQKVDEIELELERARKNTELANKSLKNELNLLKQKQEVTKKEADEATEQLQKIKSGKGICNSRMGSERATITVNY